MSNRRERSSSPRGRRRDAADDRERRRAGSPDGRRHRTTTDTTSSRQGNSYASRPTRKTHVPSYQGVELGDDKWADDEDEIDKKSTGVAESRAAKAVPGTTDDGESKSKSTTDSVSRSPKWSSSYAQAPSLLEVRKCRNVNRYERLNTIDEGVYGVVHRARCRETGKVVALKKIKMVGNIAKNGFPITSLREVNLMLKLKHPNLVRVYEVVVDPPSSTYMVMEYVENDLKILMMSMKSGSYRAFSIGEIKLLIKQLLQGIGYLHDNWIFHRDIKPSNLLYTNEGLLKTCDFGLARSFSDDRQGRYSPEVVTLWYRAPEVLLGQPYGPEIDLWSVGCVMAELLLLKPLFRGTNQLTQLSAIFSVLGQPPPHMMELKSMRVSIKPKVGAENRLPEIFQRKLCKDGLDLLSGLLQYDPKKRLSAEQALRHKWFDNAQLPILMPKFPALNEHVGVRQQVKEGA